MTSTVRCRGCGGALPAPFLDLGPTPLANAYRRPDDSSPEPTHPLRVAACPECHLVQLVETVPPSELFSEYLYFSSYSDSFLRHAERMAASLRGRLHLESAGRVLEVASNDGYLLQYFQRAGLSVLGVEPARNIAAHAQERGIPTLVRFFGPEVVDEAIAALGGRADLVVGNNVLAHVPDIVSFLRAARACLAPRGLAVFEFPYLGRTISALEYDTIYHEHVFYLSAHAIERLAEASDLELADVETHAVQGLSLRVFLSPRGSGTRSTAVTRLLQEEVAAGLTTPERFARFAGDVHAHRQALRQRLEHLRSQGLRVAAYGAPAKGNTLLNACSVTAEMIDFTVDRSPHKQGLLLPGSGIPILPPEELLRRRPDVALLLPWNLSAEIAEAQAEYRRAGGRFLLPFPAPHFLD